MDALVGRLDLPGSSLPPVRSSKALATLMIRLATGTSSPSSRTWPVRRGLRLDVVGHPFQAFGVPDDARPLVGDVPLVARGREHRGPARDRLDQRDLAQVVQRQGGATMLAAPSDQRDRSPDEGEAHPSGTTGAWTRWRPSVEAQTTPYRQVRELGEEVPMASRIIKVANAFDDLDGGRDDPPCREIPGGQRAHPPRAGLPVRPGRGRGPGRRPVRGARAPCALAVGCPAPPSGGVPWIA